MFQNNPDFSSKTRKEVIRYLLFAISFLFLARLVQMQVLEYNLYKEKSFTQAIKQVRIEPFRGNFFDRNGKLVVHSQPAFSISIVPKEFKPESLKLLAQILEVEESEIEKKLAEFKNSPKPVKVYKDLPFNKVAAIEEYNRYMPGVDLVIDYKRKYDTYASMSHLLGYTGEISPNELEKRKYYYPGDEIGKNGVELTYEDFLKGTFGMEWVAVNTWGKRVGKYNEGKLDVDAKRGFGLNLSIDLDMQTIAESMLIGKRGAVVAMNPNDGRVFVLASKPDFDLDDFSGRVPFSVYNSLVSNEGKPLQHRAISSAYPPGSSWKMLVALAALNEGIIDENTTFLCTGGMHFGDRYFRCTHTDGNVNVVDAIRSSCNVFFYNCGIKLGVKKIIEYGEKFGFGRKTGIDLPYETKGNYPTYAKLEKNYKGYIPKGLALNWGIGQGEILTSPVQMAVYTSAIANGGYLVQPRVVQSVKNYVTNKTEEINYSRKQIMIPEKYFDIVRHGMYKVVNEAHGTAQSVKLDNVKICGKTSTAQNPHGKPHGWFVSYAPYEKPELVVVAMVENAGYGGVVAAPIAKQLHKYYFSNDSVKAFIIKEAIQKIEEENIRLGKDSLNPKKKAEPGLITTN